MAPKRPSPLVEPPAASSSSSEETSSGEEEEGVSGHRSSSDEEDDEEEMLALPQALIPKNSSVPPFTPVEKKPAPKKYELATNAHAQSSSSESGSGSDSDTDTEPRRNVKSMEETPKVQNPVSKPSTSAAPARSSLKRSSDTARDAKRVKKSSEGDGAVAEDDSKKSVDESKKLFQRLWSEDDEIAILEGMIDYSANKNMDPALDMNAFHDFIKKSLHVDVTRAQLVDKIRRLKKKYRNNVDRGKKGEDPTFSKPHEQKGFELSKKIWGGEGIRRTPAVELLKVKPNVNGTPKKNQRGSTSKSLALLKTELFSSPDAPKEDDKMKVHLSEEASLGCMDGFVAFESSLGVVGLPERFLKAGLELIGQSKRIELEVEWKKLHVAELELFLKKTELIRDQAKLMLEAYKSSDK